MAAGVLCAKSIKLQHREIPLRRREGKVVYATPVNRPNFAPFPAIWDILGHSGISWGPRLPHATARITVRQMPDRLRLTIQDDGVGFDPSQTKGLGLLGIQERAARLGGSCAVHSTPGAGTILSVELPFPGLGGKPDGKEASNESYSHSAS